MTWLTVFFCFQLGWVPIGNINFNGYHQDSEPFDIVFKIEARAFNFLKVGGACTSLFSTAPYGASAVNFTPTGMTYHVFFGIEPVEGISFMFEHSCSHPVIPFSSCVKNIDAGYERIYFEIKGSVSF